MDLSWIKQQDLAVVILYKNLQTLFRFFFFRILEKLFWVPPKELDLRLEYAKSAERSEEALPHFSFMSLNSLLN